MHSNRNLEYSLTKRDLYSTSDCLKLKSRLPRLQEEVTAYNSDIICLQEVDQLDALKESLKHYDYTTCFGTQNDNSTQKKHGLVIFYHRDFELIASREISYDEHPKWPLSRKTNNVGLVTVLRTSLHTGVIVATTHLFWHPAFVYERTRQIWVLIEQCQQLRKELDVDYPIILTGDFNSEPHELVYQALVGGSIDDKERQRVNTSRVLHSSVTEGVDVPPEQGANLPITNSIPNDKAPSVDEMIAAFDDLPTFESAYDFDFGGVHESYGDRDKAMKGRKGSKEPYLTNYMPKFGMLTLDYIMYETGRGIGTEATLTIPESETLKPGLPRMDTTATSKLINGCYNPNSSTPNSTGISKLIAQLDTTKRRQSVGAALLKNIRAASRVYHDVRQRHIIFATLHILIQIIHQSSPKDDSLFPFAVQIIDTALSPPIPPDLDLRVLAVETLRRTLQKHPNAAIANEAITSFHSILFRLNGMGCIDDSDEYTRNATRKAALLGIEAVLQSTILNSLALEDRTKAVSALMPPLVDNTLPGDSRLDVLNHSVISSLDERGNTDLLSEKQDEKSIDEIDLAIIALRTYKLAFTQSSTPKWISMVVKPTLNSFDKHKRWREVKWVCWMLEKALLWTPTKYAACIPTSILEMLFESQETFPTTTKQSGYLHILTHLFMLDDRIEGLQIIAILEKLIQFVIYRFEQDNQDALAPLTITTVGALARHPYYDDQLTDMVERVVSATTKVQFGARKADLAVCESRDDLLRLLLCMLSAVLATAYAGPSDNDSDKASVSSRASQPSNASLKDTANTLPHSSSTGTPKGKERAALAPLPALKVSRSEGTQKTVRISPSDMATTVSLLIEPCYSVRAMYVRSLQGFIEGQAKSTTVSHEVRFDKFVNALTAAMWVLGTCRNLADVNVEEEEREEKAEKAEKKEEEGVQGEDGSAQDGGEKEDTVKIDASATTTAPDTSLALSRLKQMARRQHSWPSLPSNTATPTDFTHLHSLITSLHRRDSSQALLAIVPFLRALDEHAVEVLLGPGLKALGSRRGSHASWSGNAPNASDILNSNTPPKTLNIAVDERVKCRAIREIVVRCWMEIGDRWGNTTVKNLARKGLDRLGGSVLQAPLNVDLKESPVFTLSPPPPQLFPSEDDWDAVHDGESSKTVTGIVDESAAIEALVEDHNVLNATGLSARELQERLDVKWTFERALQVAEKEAFNNNGRSGGGGSNGVKYTVKKVRDKEVISLDDSDDELNGMNGGGGGGNTATTTTTTAAALAPVATATASTRNTTNTRKRRQPAASTSSSTATATKPAAKRKRTRGGSPTRVSPKLALSNSTPLPIPCDDKEGHLIIIENVELDGRYRIIRLLGQGTFGKVVEAYDRLARKNVAVKIIKSIQKYRDASRIELRVLGTLRDNDPRNEYKCIEMVDWFDFKNHICIVSDLLSESVYDFLKSNKFTPFPALHIQQMSYQLLRSVAYLHRLKLVHTDLKPENILLVSNKARMELATDRRPQRKVLDSTDIRLIDFGSATFESEYHSSVVSTRHYRAPEIILSLGWSYPCDVFSLGCIMIELMTGEALFQTHDNLEHLAMMEMVMGPMPAHFQRKAAKTKPEFFRGSKLDYPNANTSKQSRKVVRGMKRIDEIIQGRDLSSLQLINLLQQMLTFDQDERITISAQCNMRFNQFVNIIGFSVSSVTATWCVLFADFGEKEHVFSGIRREYAKQVEKFLDVDAANT
ncbi:hypothetical protein E3P99_01439 [Wallemia hederae]|uniref:Protein kinase domain-containing protein n=1 Tax=Wallemia hederae TaxID=1540922 RepID=A0A4T0FQD4_9BASI|nr:hypothetical protein E3P99_01439 [Wallemia hederae]